MENMIVWADIPVTDLERAMKFYAAVLQHPFITMDGMPGIALPGPEEPDSSAAQQGPMPVLFDLALGENQKPSTQGCTIYLNSDGDPEGMLRRVAEAGGQILVPLTDRGQMIGSIGFFQDTEGNRIGVHKPPQR